MKKIIKKTVELFNKFQTIIFMVVFVLLLLSLFNNGCQRNDFVDLTEKLTGLHIDNNLLHSSISDKDFLIEELKIDKLDINTRYNVLQEKNKSLRNNERSLKTQVANLRVELKKISGDSAYVWLQETGYPFGGDYKPFGFNVQQVKSIQIDKIESNYKDSLITNLHSQVINCDQRIENKDSLIAKTEAISINFELQVEDYKQIEKNKDKEIQVINKELRKNKRRKVFWKITTVIGTITSIIFATS